MIQSAGYAIIDNVAGTVLCVRAYANWDFPKGQLEKGESHAEAASREVLEETTLAIGVDYIDIGLEPVAITYGSGKRAKTATYFLADRLGHQQPYLPVNQELGKPENDEFRWVPFSEVSALMSPRLQPVVQRLLEWVGGSK